MTPTFFSLFHVTSTQGERYTSITSQGPFEIRFYPKSVVAKIHLQGELNECFRTGINHLQSFIEGNNLKVMKLNHCGPIYYSRVSNKWEFGLILPEALTYKQIPRPIDNLIHLEEVNPKRVGVLRYGGPFKSDVSLKRGLELDRWLTHQGLKHFGDYRVFHHDHLIHLPFKRNIEIHVDVM